MKEKLLNVLGKMSKKTKIISGVVAGIAVVLCVVLGVWCCSDSDNPEGFEASGNEITSNGGNAGGDTTQSEEEGALEQETTKDNIQEPSNEENSTTIGNTSNNEGNGSSENSNTGNLSQGSSGNNGSGAGTQDYKSVLNIDKDKLPYSQEEIFTQLFDINNKIDINIDISKSELANIQKDYEKYKHINSKSPIYRKATLYITIKTAKDEYTYQIDDIGIRMKGNTSRTDFYSSSEGMYKLIHFKIDFQETFDDDNYYTNPDNWDNDKDGKKARKNRTFATLEKLELKWNRNDDSTYIREYYAYETFRANGVIAPHTNIGAVDIGDVHAGVFVIYEPIDKVFINKNVAEKDQGGDLYKCGWTYTGASLTSDCSIGIEDEDKAEFYNYDLKTNKKTSTHEQMRKLISTLNGNGVNKEEVASVVDMDSFLKFEAVSYFVGNPDDLRNNYNNHYIYFLKSTGKAIFIPYDMDRCFGVTKGYNPNGNGMSDVSPFSKDAAGAGQRQKNPLYIYTVNEGGYYIKEFADAVKTVGASEWLKVDKFKKIYNIAFNNYSKETTPSKLFQNAGGFDFSFSLERNAGLYSNDKNASFGQYISAKMQAYLKYIKKAEQLADKVNVQSYYIRGSFTDWKKEDGYEMTYDKYSKTYSYMLTLSSKSPLKVNNGVEGEPGWWYGMEEVVSYPSGVEVKADQDDNIVLPAGTYTIIFDPEAKSITIKK